MSTTESSLEWSDNPGAADGTYRIEARSRTAESSATSRSFQNFRSIVAGALLSGGAAMATEARIDSLIPPPAPSNVHQAPGTTVHSDLSIEESRLRAKLESYGELEDDWDGEGATAPSKAAVGDVLKFLDARPDGIPLPLPEVASIGDIGIYWDHDSIFAEVQFEGDRKYSFYAQRTETRETVEEYGRDGIAISEGWHDEILQVLRRLAPSHAQPA